MSVFENALESLENSSRLLSRLSGPDSQVYVRLPQSEFLKEDIGKFRIVMLPRVNQRSVDLRERFQRAATGPSS